MKQHIQATFKNINFFSRLKYGVIGIGLFVMFIKFIPTWIYCLSPVLIASAATISITCFLTMSLFDYTSWDKFRGMTKKDENTFLVALVFFMFLGGGLSTFFILHYSHNEEIELARYGMNTEAVVMKKDVSKYIKGDRGTNEIYYVELTFEDVHHAKHVAREIVSEDFYSDVEKGDVLKIRYSQRHPTVVNIQAKHI